MPSSSKSVHGLNLWTENDHPLREDFVQDNQTIDDLLTKHMADTTLHKTATDGAAVVIGSYVGNGNSNQKIVLDFRPCLVLVFATDTDLVGKDSSGNLVLYFGMAVQGYSPNGFTVLSNKVCPVNEKAAEVYTQTNKAGQTYGYIAFR